MAGLVHVHVTPGSAKGPLVEEQPDGSLRVWVREKAVEGAANDAVERVLAAHFGVSVSRVTVRRGHTSRRKVVEVVD